MVTPRARYRAAVAYARASGASYAYRCALGHWSPVLVARESHAYRRLSRTVRAQVLAPFEGE